MVQLLFARWCQCGHIDTIWWIRLNLSFLRPLESTTQKANRSVQPFLHSSCQKVPILNNGWPFPLKLPLLMRDLYPHLINDSLGESSAQSKQHQCITIGSAIFAQVTAECPYPLKIALPMGDLDPHLIHGSLGPPESSNQTASRLVQPFLQGSLVWQTERQTDQENTLLDR